MNLFQGNWGTNPVHRMETNNDLEIEKAFEEIDRDLGGHFNESRLRLKEKSSGKPLILAPPVIKSVEEKPAASKRRITMDDTDEESSDQTESYIDRIDSIDSDEVQESSEESYSEIMFEESSGLQNYIESDSFGLEESMDEPFNIEDHNESLEDLYESSSEPMKLATAAYRGKHSKTEVTKVRLPLHLADVDLEIDIFDTFKLSRPISTVSNVECSLHSIDAEVLLPSANLFTKGTLLLDIDYVSPDDKGTMHSLKIHIPWKKIILVKWVHQPELSSKDSKEYLFTSNLGLEEGYTREYSESLVEKVDFSLSSLHCVWNEQFIQNDRVMIQGTAKMKIDLFQKQCLDLQKLLSL